MELTSNWGLEFNVRLIDLLTLNVRTLFHLRRLGFVDPDEAIAAGIAALKARYGIRST